MRREGNLIYVPTDVLLCKFDTDGKQINKYFKVEKPAHLLVTEDLRDLYEVLYEGDRWYVKKTEVYEVKDE